MSKQLRLDVAQLTDVGRKREHNEDNMAYVIPKDQQVMTKKGALFIVADGMGGHAAGEVASEIAVDTVSNAYYQEDSNDIAASLLYAIRRANAAIHQRAAENMLRSGMGTTCVATVLRGNRAYIANVGDSRAYLVRDGKVRQVSQDHSWVAEQVRAGLLSEDQARTHAQRNVITRCLGTQAEVEVDVFSEQMEDGDTLVLCTDGLSGLISDEELTKIVNAFLPQESVYHLVERANENGGPDNITAIVVHINEVGEPVAEPPYILESESSKLTLPVHIGGRESREVGEDTPTLATQFLGSSVSNGRDQLHPYILPSSPVALSSRNDEGSISSSLRIASGPLVSPESVTATHPSLERSNRRRRNRLFYPTLALVVLFIVVLALGGVYYFVRSNDTQYVDQTVRNAQSLINQAQGESLADPAQALSDLGAAQNLVRGLQKNYSLTATQIKTITSLQGRLTQEVRTAITTYNTRSAINVLPCANTTKKLINNSSTNTQALSIVSILRARNTSKQVLSLLYALGQDSKLYRLNDQPSLVSSDVSQVASIAGAGSELFVLMKQSGTDTSNYTLSLFSPDASGKLKQLSSVPIASPSIGNGNVPTLITAWGSNVYVVLSSTSSQNNAFILDYTLDSKGQLSKIPMEVRISVSANILSVAAFPHQLFLLLADGGIMGLAFGGGQGNSLPFPVLLQQPIPAPLTVLSSGDYSSTMDVPVITPMAQKGNASLTLASATALAAGVVNNTPHLYILDPVNHRILDLIASSSGPAASLTATTNVSGTTSGIQTLSVLQQYASSNLSNSVKSITVDATGMYVYALVQSSSTMLNLLSMTTGQQTKCAL